ncbi:MAG: OadG family protein [Spirochaetaceae bacterium]|jgi:sodium pump decarboxylase gamma subunit|nr:OadG family protein [Spirochaetaceae bacterium]
MTITEMFNQSGALALLGMSVVFSFLVVLIAAISAAGRLIHALGLDKDAIDAPSAGQTAKAAPGSLDNAVVAAITAAIKSRRSE